MAYEVGILNNLVARVEDAIALVQTNLDHVRIHRGEIYTKSAALAAMNDGTSYVLHLKTGAAAEYHMTFAAAGSGAGFVRLYEDPTKTVDGTPITMLNHMRIAANQRASTFSLFHTPTTSANGTLLAEIYLGSGNKGAGDVDAREEEWVLKPSSSYLLILESDAASNIMSYAIKVYEKP